MYVYLLSSQIAARILDAHTALQKTSLVESKMLYIRKWQGLPEFGVSHFIVKFRSDKPSKKEVCDWLKFF